MTYRDEQRLDDADDDGEAGSRFQLNNRRRRADGDAPMTWGEWLAAHQPLREAP